jgi:hypothetical protein
VAQYTQLCRLTVPLSLKVVSLDKTMKLGKDSLSSHTCRIHSQNSIRRSGSSSFTAQSSLGIYSFHFSCCRIRWTLVLGTPISREHCLTDFFGDCAKACKTVVTLSLLVELRGLSDHPLLKFCTVPSISNLWRYLVIVTCVGDVPNSFLRRLYVSTALSVFQWHLSINLRF